MVAAPAGHETRVKTRDGLELSVREWGNAAGPEVLLIHGLAQCHLSFERQVGGLLADQFRLVAFDLRGHGASDKPLDPAFYQYGTRWADDIELVMDTTALRHPVLVGWSLGGRVIRQYLTHYGDKRLSGINFLATRPIEDPSVIGPGSSAASAGQALDFRDRLQSEIDFLQNCFEKQPDEATFRLALAFNLIMPRVVRETTGSWPQDREEAERVLGAVNVPVMVTHGRRDKLILPRAAELTAAAVKNARMSWYDDCGHAPFYEDAERYNRELGAFVAEAWGARHSAEPDG